MMIERIYASMNDYSLCVLFLLTKVPYAINPLIGLSFYTSEKTLRAAFEGFGELVEGTSLVALIKFFRTVPSFI